jgi:RNA 2',3'-cyclic 3'-phosphodiesterase
MQRLFVGLSIPPDICRRLHLLQGGLPGARWTPPENYHITLAFIGGVSESMAADIDEALSSVRHEGFSLALKGTGQFAQGDDPDVLWIGVEKSAALAGLKGKIDRALEKSRLPFDRRSYAPHVTLARFRTADKDRLALFMQEHNLFTVGPFEVQSFILYASHLTKNGPAYEALASYPLMLPQIS